MIATGPGWTLHLGDCIEGMRDLADDSIDVAITDPPYSEHTHEKQWIGAALTEDGAKRVKTSHRGLGFDHMTPIQAAAVAMEFRRLVRRWVLIFTDLEGIALWRIVLGKAGLDYVRTCIWDKVDGAPQFTGDRPAAGAEAIVVAHRRGKKKWNGGGRRNVFRYGVDEEQPDGEIVFQHAVNGQRGDKPHPTTKPLPLMSELVELFSNPDELVLDPFAGSGSTGLACRMLGRNFLGWEIDPGFHAIAARKIAGGEAKPRDVQPSLFGGLT